MKLWRSVYCQGSVAVPCKDHLEVAKQEVAVALGSRLGVGLSLVQPVWRPGDVLRDKLGRGGPCLRLVHPSRQQLINISTLDLLELSPIAACSLPAHRAGGRSEAVTQDTAWLQAARPSSPRTGMRAAHCSTPQKFLPQAGRIPTAMRMAIASSLLDMWPGQLRPPIGCSECPVSASDTPPP